MSESCPNCGHECDGGDDKSPRVSYQLVSVVGGCNYCTARHSGMKVFVIRSARNGGSEIRACRSCMQSIVAQVSSS